MNDKTVYLCSVYHMIAYIKKSCTERKMTRVHQANWGECYCKRSFKNARLAIGLPITNLSDNFLVNSRHSI